MAVDAGASWTVSPVAAVSGRDEFDRTAFMPYGDRACSWKLMVCFAWWPRPAEPPAQNFGVTCVLVRVVRREEVRI